MSADDPLTDWAKSRRLEPVPADFSQRVMTAIASGPSRPTDPQADLSRPRGRERLEHLAGLLLIVCSCVVVAVRLSSIVGLVVPSTDDRVITREFFDESEEVSHVAPDVT